MLQRNNNNISYTIYKLMTTFFIYPSIYNTYILTEMINDIVKVSKFPKNIKRQGKNQPHLA